MSDTLRAVLIFPIGTIALLLVVLAFARAASFVAVNLFAWLTMRPGRRYTGWRWDVVRGYVLNRDDRTCQECHASYRTMDVHHKRPVARGGSYQTWNLVTLCRYCHKRQVGHEHMQGGS